MSTTTLSTPYADAVGEYQAAGWTGLLPLPAAAKFPPPTGYTGPQGSTPTPEQIGEWAEIRPDANLALRLPENVIGIDVDAYGDKPGAQTLAEHEARWGALPATWMSTSRDDGISAIRYFRVPAGLAYPSWLGGKEDGVEIIRHGHRYAVVPPSVHPSGAAYRWITPDGEDASRIPDADELPELPAGWVSGMTGGVADRSRATDTEVHEFLAGLNDEGTDTDVRRIVDEFAAFLDEGKPGRHEEMLRVTWELAVAGATGALGVPTALAEAETLFIAARSSGTRTSDREAEREWMRGLAGAVAHLADRAPVLPAWDVPPELQAAIEAVFDKAKQKKADNAKSYNPASTDDAHLGARIAEEYLRGRWAWSSGLGWLSWDGRRWERVAEAAVREAVRKALLDAHGKDTSAANARLEARQAKARNTLTETEEIRQEMDAASKEHGERLRSIRCYFSLGKIKSVQAIAQGILIEDAETFDAQPHLLNVGNGVVDLRNGELLPHQPQLRFTKITEVCYRPDAVHEDWDAALRAVPADTREWLRIRFGQAATGFTPDDDVVPFLYGGGSNGKSTVVLGITKALGEFATYIPDKVLLLNPGDHPTEMMTLLGARLALLEELPQGRFLDAKRLKTVAGTGAITARYTGKDNVSWSPTHSLFVTTNYELRVDENDHGTWRRLARVPFPYRFGAELPKDAGLRPRLDRGDEGQHEAVLAWIVSGAVDWYKAQRTMPDAPAPVAESTREWRGTADILGRFLGELTETDENSAVLSRELYEVFRTWAAEHGHRAWTDQLFWERFKAHPAVTEGTVNRPEGKARLGGRAFSSPFRTPKPLNPTRLVFGLSFTEDAKSYTGFKPNTPGH